MQIAPVTLAGRHARLEPLAPVHFEALARHGAEAEIWRWTANLHPDPRESVRLWCERSTAVVPRGEGVAFAVIDVTRGEAVGGTTYMDISRPDRRLEIGSTWLGRAVWRTAINTECKFLLLRHAFETLEMNRVQLKTDARNVRSQTAIARLGAVREGVLRSHMVMPDGWVRDTVIFSIVASEWPAVKARLERLMAR